jgi:hypothetical protein
MSHPLAVFSRNIVNTLNQKLQRQQASIKTQPELVVICWQFFALSVKKVIMHLLKTGSNCIQPTQEERAIGKSESVPTIRSRTNEVDCDGATLGYVMVINEAGSESLVEHEVEFFCCGLTLT